MIRLAVVLLLACMIIPAAVPAKRVGVVRVFSTVIRDVHEGKHQIVVKVVKDKRGRRIGSIAQVCTQIGERQSCVGTLEMPLGKLMFMGTRSSPRYYVFALVGGTGVYSGSGGQYVSSTIALKPRVEYVLVSLVP